MPVVAVAVEEEEVVVVGQCPVAAVAGGGARCNPDSPPSRSWSGRKERKRRQQVSLFLDNLFFSWEISDRRMKGRKRREGTEGGERAGREGMGGGRHTM